MGHGVPEFEQIDAQGTTLNVNGTVTPTAALYPSSSFGHMARILIKNLTSNPSSRIIYVSFDGVTFFSLSRGEFLEWYPRKNASAMPIEQIFVKCDSGTADFESIMDFDP